MRLNAMSEVAVEVAEKAAIADEAERIKLVAEGATERLGASLQEAEVALPWPDPILNLNLALPPSPNAAM